MADDPTTPDAASDQADVELRNIMSYIEQIAEIRVRNGPYDDGFIAGMVDVRDVIQARLTIRAADPDAGRELWSALDSLLDWWGRWPEYELKFDDPRYRDAWNAGYRQAVRDQNGTALW